MQGVLPDRGPRVVGEPRLLTNEELHAWMGDVRWIYAASMPQHPHHYTLRREQDEDRFLRVVATIWEAGYDRRYLRRLWRSLDVAEYLIWVHTEPTGPDEPAPLQTTVLINKALRTQDRLL